ncbi:putative inorganic phosphate cotransporter isoform X2 [Euwallacea similis]|uniref:putative inorganic phosphate cotransporter isoform X2 n=1 Tax=Euwallacea similis TaxID=1736056 RepID=UPI00344B0393
MGLMDLQSRDLYYSPIIQHRQNAKAPVFGVRHLQVLLLFIMVFAALGFNVTLSVTIVAMTDRFVTINPDVPVYELQSKGIILSAFFWGYIWPQVFAGYVATRYGAKSFLIGAMAVQTILGVLMPFTVANFGFMGICISRALQGFCQGFLFPSLTHQLGRWVPKEERSRLGAFAFGGVPLGIVVGMLVAGLVSGSWYGWPLVFYLYGGLTALWCVIFWFFGFNSPGEHPTISDMERCYIEHSLGEGEKENSQLHLKIPWVQILSSVPVWALLITQSGYIYCTSTFLSQIPSYMSHVMRFNLGYNGLLSALPFFILWIFSFVFSFSSDFLINKGFVSTGTARKIFNSIGLVGCAICLTTLSFVEANRIKESVILLVLAVGVLASCMSGWSINHIDLSPKYAGALMGLTNGLAHIAAVVSPLVNQLVVKDQSNSRQWVVVFLMAATVAVVTAIIFVVFGSGEVQSWNDLKDDSENDKKKNILQ